MIHCCFADWMTDRVMLAERSAYKVQGEGVADDGDCGSAQVTGRELHSECKEAGHEGELRGQGHSS